MESNIKLIEETLYSLSGKELKSHILAYAERDENFLENFMGMVSTEVVGKPYKEYLQKIKKCFTEPFRCYNNRGYYSEEMSIAGMLDKCLIAINDNLDNGKYRDAVRELLAIIEIIGHIYEDYTDMEGIIANECQKAIGLLTDILKSEKSCPAEVKVEAREKIERLNLNSNYEDFDLGDLDALLLLLSVQLTSVDEGLKLLNLRIDSSEGWKKTENILSKIELMYNADMISELNDFIEEHLELPEVRKFKLGMLIDAGKLDEVILCIKSGLKLAEKEHSRKLEIEWKDLLLDVYVEQSDVKNILALSEELFYNGYDPRRYFPVIKRYTLADEWKKTFNRLLRSLNEPAQYVGVNNIKAWIFIKEKMWNMLLELVLKGDIETLFKYEKELKPYYAEKILAVLVTKLKDYASKSKDVEHYRFMAKVLGKMRTYPNGDKTVDDLIIEFHIGYSKQKDMLEIIKGI